MRLLVVTELFLPTKGGTAVWFDAVYRRLGGKEIHIVTADVPGAAAHDADSPNTIHRVSLQRHWWLKPESLAMYLKLFFTGLRVALTQPIQAVHAGKVLPEGLAGWLIARLIRKPIAIYAHGEEITTWLQPGKFKAMRFAYRHADRVIANSDFTRNELLKLGVAPDKITLISPGVDVERLRPNLPAAHLRAGIGLREGQKLILSVGRLHRRKGFDQVIKTLPRLLQQGMDVCYVIIGIGEDQQYLEALIQEQSMAERVRLLGHVAPDDLPLWYNACDVFVMANREIDGDTEGFGMVFIEAAACGKSAIAGKAGGTGAAVLDGVTGLRVDGARIEDIQQALSRLLSDDALRRQFESAGLRRAQQEFSWAAVAEKTTRLAL